jgi:hypothetical protein
VSDQRDDDPGIKKPEPDQDETEVVAGGSQADIGRVAFPSGEPIALQQLVSLETSNNRINGATPA